MKDLQKEIEEIIKGNEPVNNPEPDGFYWEYDQMEKCAKEIISLFIKATDEIIGEDNSHRYSIKNPYVSVMQRNQLRFEQRQRRDSMIKK